ncbi:MAG: hypothetical protein RSE41_11075 [Clostridia bacterium]
MIITLNNYITNLEEYCQSNVNKLRLRECSIMPMLPKNGAYWSIIKSHKKSNKDVEKCILCDKNNNSWCLLNHSWCSSARKTCAYNNKANIETK